MGCNSSQPNGNGCITFGYWGVRGSGQVCRLVLAYCGASWDDVKYTQRQKWFNQDKKKLGFTFPNLPYLIDKDCDLKLTQSKAINQYVIKKCCKTQLLGRNLRDQAMVDCILSVLVDIRNPLFELLMDKQWPSKVKGVNDKIMPKLQQLTKYYGKKQFALGYLTLIDFYVTQLSYYIEKITPDCYNKCDFLRRTRNSFECLPQIKKYYQSPMAFKGPFVPPMAAIQI